MGPRSFSAMHSCIPSKMSHDRDYSSGHDDRDARRDSDDHAARSMHSRADESEARAPAVRSMDRPGRKEA